MDELIHKLASRMMGEFEQQLEAPPGLHGQENAWAAKGGSVDMEKVARSVISEMMLQGYLPLKAKVLEKFFERINIHQGMKVHYASAKASADIVAVKAEIVDQLARSKANSQPLPPL